MPEVFGEVIRERREGAGLSQEDLSFACSRHRTYISLIERGKSSPTVTTVWLLATALGTTPSELVAAAEQRLAPAPAATPTAARGAGARMAPSDRA